MTRELYVDSGPNEKRNGFPRLEECIYTSCYCEENIWKICDGIKEDKELLTSSYAVFVSNNKRFVPLWCQKSGKSKENGFVIWDYHVFLVCMSDSGTFIYDLDTRLDFPSLFTDYVKKALLDDADLKPEVHRKFRVIRGDRYLEGFASDRRHMRHKDGSWIKPPPTYTPIQIEGAEHNLDEFISMDPNVGIGTVMSYNQFVHHFTRSIKQ